MYKKLIHHLKYQNQTQSFQSLPDSIPRGEFLSFPCRYFSAAVFERSTCHRCLPTTCLSFKEPSIISAWWVYFLLYHAIQTKMQVLYSLYFLLQSFKITPSLLLSCYLEIIKVITSPAFNLMWKVSLTL